MNLSQFYNEVARNADTAGSKINVAETKRVLAVGFQILSKMSAAESADIIAKGLAAGAKKKTVKKKKATRKKKAKKR